MIDPKGTQPGVTPSAPEPTIVAMKCRNECGSMHAQEIKIESTGSTAPQTRLYQCTKCQASFYLPVGGFFPY